MTGEKNRLKTHEQLWKLEDGELSTPKHDELVIQLLNRENIKKIDALRYESNLIYKGTDEDGHSKDMGFLEFSDRMINNKWVKCNSKGIDELHETRPEKTLKDAFETGSYNVESEKPITNGQNRFIIGYADIYISFEKIFSVEVERSITFQDMVGGVDDCEVICKYEAIIEVKPKIKSFGETLRQIRTYQEYSNAAMFIYSPDTHFKAAFESQGIGFITPTDIFKEIEKHV